MPFLPPNQQRQSTEGKWKQEKLKTKNGYASIDKQSGESVESVRKKQRRQRWAGFRERKVFSVE